jgi:anti-sigma factor RsiW
MNHMHCNEFVELVTAFLDGALAPGDERRFVDHLAFCDGCERYFAQFRATIDMLSEPPADRLPDDERTALLTAFRERRA